MVFEISILYLLHEILSKSPWMEVDLFELQILWWEIGKMNENEKFERIDEENERKRKCVETEEINQINLFILSSCSLCDDFWLFWLNEWT